MRFILGVWALACLSLCACFPTPQPRVQELVVDNTPIKIGEVTIKNGKTTKQEVLSALGNPKSMTEHSITYDKPKNRREYYQIHMIQKDGTQFDECVGDRDGCKSSILIHLDYEKPTIIDDVAFYGG